MRTRIEHTPQGIKYVMHLCGVTANDIAGSCQRDPSTIYKILNGRRSATSEELEVMARATLTAMTEKARVGHITTNPLPDAEALLATERRRMRRSGVTIEDVAEETNRSEYYWRRRLDRHRLPSPDEAIELKNAIDRIINRSTQNANV